MMIDVRIDKSQLHSRNHERLLMIVPLRFFYSHCQPSKIKNANLRILVTFNFVRKCYPKASRQIVELIEINLSNFLIQIIVVE